MRTEWIRRLGALEGKFLPAPDGLPGVVYGLREDGKQCFLGAGWQHDGKCKEWSRSSGDDLPEELKQLSARKTIGITYYIATAYARNPPTPTYQGPDI